MVYRDDIIMYELYYLLLGGRKEFLHSPIGQSDVAQTVYLTLQAVLGLETLWQ